ncbi:hypothetical protein GCM10008961_30180 [Deinococcus knuensis]|uniref:Uncharacterized protein n=1 Tax=Deinococcus knuensis TaxID=1837380 RepID=A0ABQ2SPV5_9DEIO|nr:hypothetical protein GCM10008961_30180 [Deinococcus knuensis]
MGCLPPIVQGRSSAQTVRHGTVEVRPRVGRTVRVDGALREGGERGLEAARVLLAVDLPLGEEVQEEGGGGRTAHPAGAIDEA